MAKYVKLKMGATSWSNCCAQCLRNDLLVQYEKETLRTTKTNYVVVSKLVTRSYVNSYPVCKTHHAQIAGGERLFGFLSAMLIGLLIISIVPIGVYWQLGKQGIYAALAVFAICAMLYWRRLVINKVPIWVSEIGEDFVVLRFSNNKYAEQFLQANKEVSKLGGRPIDFLL